MVPKFFGSLVSPTLLNWSSKEMLYTFSGMKLNCSNQWTRMKHIWFLWPLIEASAMFKFLPSQILNVAHKFLLNIYYSYLILIWFFVFLMLKILKQHFLPRNVQSWNVEFIFYLQFYIFNKLHLRIRLQLQLHKTFSCLFRVPQPTLKERVNYHKVIWWSVDFLNNPLSLNAYFLIKRWLVFCWFDISKDLGRNWLVKFLFFTFSFDILTKARNKKFCT